MDIDPLSEDLQVVLDRLRRSRFRSRFRLNRKEKDYLRKKGFAEILEHGRNFIAERLAPALPLNDGKQTPMRNHPVFVAQHATATCCRGCLEKWHGIPRGKALTASQQDYILNLIGQWIITQTGTPDAAG